MHRRSCLRFVLPLLAATGLRAQTTTEQELPAAPGWRAAVIHQADSGVWYAHVDKVVDGYGQNEVIAADDKGRHLLLSVYSGQWTAQSVVCDGLWLAPTKSADVDPRVPGRELYAGGRAGSLHRTILRPQPFAKFTLESVEIGHSAGEEFHSVLAADLLPERAGDEVLAFGITGAVFLLVPAGADGNVFSMTKIGTVPGRVRDTVVLPAGDGAPPVVLGVSRSGDLLRMQVQGNALVHRVLLHEDSGLGRVAASPVARDVVYVTRDDGLVVRVTLRGEAAAERQPVFAGDQGLRGIAAGRFFADGREALAVYGYGKQVHLLARKPDGTFDVEVLFTGAQKGHWLCAGELDGRNTTDELVATGFDGQVVLLAREPGHGLPGTAVRPATKAAAAAIPPATGAPVLRLAARFGPRAVDELSPLRYQGGFETKAMVYETLVRRSADGRIVPGLASSFRTEQDGKVVVFALRTGALFHDGTPVTAATVVTHFRRWVGLPEHDWLACNRRIVAVRANAKGEVEIELDRPHALLPYLCAINPTAIRAPASLSREGDFVRPVGSGPFAFVEACEDGRVLRYQRHDGKERVDLVRCEGDELEALLRGEVDAVVGSWMMPVDPARAAALRGDPRVQVAEGPGSSVRHLALRFDRGPLQSLAHRRAVATAIDRAALVRDVLHGFGDACTGWAAPSVADWPAGKLPPATKATFDRPLRFAAAPADEAFVTVLRAQLQAHGIPTERVVGDGARDDWDLRLERTHGVPYDPFVTVVERFGQPAAEANAATAPAAPVDPTLARLVEALAAEPDATKWPALYGTIQERLDALLPIVPLVAPRRIAVVRQGLPVPVLTHDMYAVPAEWLAAAVR